ncbi:DUF2231 domain-containing protein [Hoyosella subflava]|uniref:DUF2231 domain-containing protein n=1 Tax=Hoyosella subflava (strain DSM 45089 / JCM 17490 / NBRC 109087 / DQS3-9A1) TaxID=443218 RepID=F6EI97_HOYSD|nr:DUF2231 domain-containing protein [Hoyosella subflava]AEF41204.1 hypothetical protein AS9A_2757 [Hoyosella subflava DQS3-9A1]
MFDQVFDLPLHPLVVHAAVVFIPLAGLLGVLLVVPRTRSWARLPLLLVSLAAAASAFVARESGQSLLIAISATAPPEELRVAAEHEQDGDRLFYITVAYALVAVIAYIVSAPGKTLYRGALGIVLSVLLVLGAGALIVQSVIAGHSGATAVWNHDGTIDYST